MRNRQLLPYIGAALAVIIVLVTILSVGGVFTPPVDRVSRSQPTETPATTEPTLPTETPAPTAVREESTPTPVPTEIPVPTETPLPAAVAAAAAIGAEEEYIAFGGEDTIPTDASESGGGRFVSADDTYRYILNSNTFKFHYPGCRAVEQMSPENKVYFNGTREEAISRGYVPCRICCP